MADNPGNQAEKKYLVRIHIDQQPYESPNPTTGAALYELGQVKPGLTLFQEVQGNHEDSAISRDAQEVHLKKDEHFYSAEALPKEYHIIVNTEPKSVDKAVLIFAEVVAIAFPTPMAGENVIYTVTYKHAVAPMPKGSLSKGESVTVKNGTIFNVTETDKS